MNGRISELKKVTVSLLTPAVLLPFGVLLFGAYLVYRLADFRHLPKGVYPVGLDGDFGVWSRRRACENRRFADAVERYDYRHMTPAQQVQWQYDNGWLIDPVERYPNDLCRSERGEVVRIVKQLPPLIADDDSPAIDAEAAFARSRVGPY